MGIGAKTQRDRVEAVVKYVLELLSDMVTDEENLLNELIKNIETYKVELLSVAQILGFPPYEVRLVLYRMKKNSTIKNSLKEKF